MGSQRVRHDLDTDQQTTKVLSLPLTCGPCQAVSIKAKLHSMEEGKLEKKRQKKQGEVRAISQSKALDVRPLLRS